MPGHGRSKNGVLRSPMMAGTPIMGVRTAILS